MASLVKKIIRGNAYYYTRESQRVNGKPKVVRQIYLGRADDIDRHIPKRGQGPSVGTYLRIVGLALLVSADSHLPVLHSTYPGNRPDAPHLPGPLRSAHRPLPRRRQLARVRHPGL